MTPPGFVVAPGYGIGGAIDALVGAVDPAPPQEGGGDDAYWMRRALLSAMAAEGRASPNPTVGAVIVKDGVLIATGATEPYGQRHAERCAIDSVADRSVLRGATIYTTLEPCAHWGKQPPCADLVASVGFARCVAGLRDPNPSVAGVGIERVRLAGAQVLSGVLRNEIVAWHLPYLFPYLHSPSSPRPFISTLALHVSDGAGPEFRLGCSDGWDEWDMSRQYRSWLKQKCDLVITEPSLASIDPAAFARAGWRGVVWWDTDGRFARMSVAQARELGAQAGDLGVPVVIVSAADRDNAAQLDACASAGVGHIVPPTGPDPASRLTAFLSSAELAAVTGAPPSWIVVDEHPRLAGLLVAEHAVDAVHALHAGPRRATGGARSGPGDDPVVRLTGATAAGSWIADDAAAGTGISEYFTQRLSSALAGTAW